MCMMESLAPGSGRLARLPSLLNVVVRRCARNASSQARADALPPPSKNPAPSNRIAEANPVVLQKSSPVAEAPPVQAPPTLIPEAEHIVLEESFPAADTSLVPSLRSHFLQRFADPLATKSDRFVWDYWHVPGQYTLLRTPAERFFGPALYDRLEDALIEWGERVLGCRGISPVWCSYYVTGCRQELHTDSPHGPWAFVLSLTDWEARRFSGGETIILKPSVLSYWETLDPSRGLETPQLMTLVPPRLGQLTVFDPRLPHGVKLVEGVSDSREARIVLHGWFTPPTPFFEGALPEEEITPVLNDLLEELYNELAALEIPAVGTLVARFTVDGGGQVADLRFLKHSLVMLAGEEDIEDIGECIRRAVEGAAWPESEDGGSTTVTLPFEFR